MYPRIPGPGFQQRASSSHQPEQRPQGFDYGRPQPSFGSSNTPAPASSSQGPSVVGGAWAPTEAGSTLRVKVADEYRLDPPVQLPPAMEAATRPQQSIDFEYERKVMQEEPSTSMEAFFAKPESSYYADNGVGKFLAMGFSPAAVSLAVAYQAGSRGDQSQVVDFCNNYTQLLGMGFSPSLAAGALVQTKNDVNAATELCLSASS